jgi:hypothetical protein
MKRLLARVATVGVLSATGIVPAVADGPPEQKVRKVRSANDKDTKVWKVRSPNDKDTKVRKVRSANDKDTKVRKVR